jgi:hypothetical protein
MVMALSPQRSVDRFSFAPTLSETTDTEPPSAAGSRFPVRVSARLMRPLLRLLLAYFFVGFED